MRNALGISLFKIIANQRLCSVPIDWFFFLYILTLLWNWTNLLIFCKLQLYCVFLRYIRSLVYQKCTCILSNVKLLSMELINLVACAFFCYSRIYSSNGKWLLTICAQNTHIVKCNTSCVCSNLNAVRMKLDDRYISVDWVVCCPTPWRIWTF